MQQIWKIIFLLTILVFVLVPSSGSAQQRIVKGMIRDAVTAEPLGYANVMLRDNITGTVTNQQGKFFIPCTQIDQELTVTCLGYKSQKMALRPTDTMLTIALTPTSYLLQEVNIFAGSSMLDETSNNQMKGEQVAQMSGLTRDVYRAVQTLPGVSSNNEMNAEFNVRGGTFDENLVMIDGVRVYEPFHLKEIPNISVGIFNVDMVQKIDFMSGGFSAEYGDALSSVLNIKYRKGNAEHIAGSAYTSLIDGGFMLEGPLSEKCTWIIGVRQSYLGLMTKMMKAKSGVYVTYNDVQGQISYKLSPMNTISLGLILSNDYFTMTPSNKVSTILNWGIIFNQRLDGTRNQRDSAGTDYSNHNRFASLKWSSVFSPVLLLESAFTYANEHNYQKQYGLIENQFFFPTKPDYYYIYRDSGEFINDLDIVTTEALISLSYQPTAVHTFKVGGSYQQVSYIVDRLLSASEVKITNLTEYYPDTSIYVYPIILQNNDSTNLSVDDTYKWNAYIQDQWQATEDLVFNIGGRIDYFDMNKELSFSPRISASYSFMTQWCLRAAWGIYYQTPTYNQLKMSIPSSKNTANERALHYIIGLEHHPSDDVNIRFETYYKLYTDLIPVERSSNGILSYPTKETNFEGYAYGMDAYGSINFSGLYASFSYSFLISKERLKNSGDEYKPRVTDQRHTISSALSTQLGSRWSGSIRCFYGSGYAFTPMKSVYNKNLDIQQWVTDNENSEYFPPYFRIDLRLEKQYTLWNNPLSVYLDIINVLSRQNVLLYKYTYDANGVPTREPVTLFPIIPSIGVSYKF
jgi:outer membrane receptor for ferrienterochelin and colicin